MQGPNITFGKKQNSNKGYNIGYSRFCRGINNALDVPQTEEQLDKMVSKEHVEEYTKRDQVMLDKISWNFTKKKIFYPDKDPDSDTNNEYINKKLLKTKQERRSKKRISPEYLKKSSENNDLSNFSNIHPIPNNNNQNNNNNNKKKKNCELYR